MSISIDVEGFYHLPDLPPFNSGTSVRKASLQWRSELLRLICEQMKWQSAPWSEPNEKAVPEGDSCSWTSFEKLCHFARQLESQKVELRFLHLLRRYDNGEIVIYLPTEFEQPFAICTGNYPDCCTIGSSMRLNLELKKIKFHFDKLSNEADMSQGDIETIAHVLDKLLKYSQLSSEVQLPMFMSW